MKNKETFLLIFFLILTVFNPIRLEFCAAEKYLFEKYEWLTPTLYEIVYSECNAQGLDEKFFLALIDAESGGNPKAINKSSGARGMGQIMHFHVSKKNLHLLFEPRYNVNIGCGLFRQYLDLARGNIVLALRNYERGPRGKGLNVKYIASIIGNYYGE